MTDKVQKIREWVKARLDENTSKQSLPQFYGMMEEDARFLDFLDSLQEEPVSEDLEKAAEEYSFNIPSEIFYDLSPVLQNIWKHEIEAAFKDGAQWQKEHLWRPADGDDLPEIDREVIALLDNGKVVFAHRPPEYWDGKDIITGKVTRNYPKTYDKGGWNISDVKYWLDVELPKE